MVGPGVVYICMSLQPEPGGWGVIAGGAGEGV
jgi:hypothetical protein